MEQDGLGEIQRLYFVDHKMKASFSAEELGVSLNQISRLRSLTPGIKPAAGKSPSRVYSKKKGKAQTMSPSGATLQHAAHLLLKQEPGSFGGGGGAPKKKKKRRRPLS
jgi:hypothetical protein